jgi:hypothetical protein
MTDTPAPSPSPTSPPRSRRRFWILISLVVLVIGLWSAYWTVARGMAVDILRNTYEVAETEGGALVCGDQRLGGYPFRFELECQPFEARDAQARAGALAGLRVIALAYNPRHVIVEADGPATLRFDNPHPFDRLSADWTSARASARLVEAGLRDADLFIEEPKISGISADAAVSLAASRATVHARRSPSVPEDADFALRLAGLAVPALEGTAEISADATLAGGAAVLAGRGDWMALFGQDEAVRVSELRASASGVNLRATGTLFSRRQGPAGRNAAAHGVGGRKAARAARPLLSGRVVRPDIACRCRHRLRRADDARRSAGGHGAVAVRGGSGPCRADPDRVASANVLRTGVAASNASSPPPAYSDAVRSIGST